MLGRTGPLRILGALGVIIDVGVHSAVIVLVMLLWGRRQFHLFHVDMVRPVGCLGTVRRLRENVGIRLCRLLVVVICLCVPVITVHDSVHAVDPLKTAITVRVSMRLWIRLLLLELRRLLLVHWWRLHYLIRVVIIAPLISLLRSISRISETALGLYRRRPIQTRIAFVLRHRRVQRSIGRRGRHFPRSRRWSRRRDHGVFGTRHGPVEAVSHIRKRCTHSPHFHLAAT